MSKTAQLVMKIIGASLALAAVVCLLIGGWNDLTMGIRGMQSRHGKDAGYDEFDDYADDQLYI
ncbi:hypothetical protein RFF05_07860 [Bengtsoniella intestinalis]|uniref:hypothetical protein n=1 Tax=Bengtsoniella intestinalis TaxID=3073143 RepID=UPI00391F76C8